MNTKNEIYIILTLQCVLFILFCIFTVYEEDEYNETYKYPLFQDVHVMIFIGFGYLMTFLRRYCYSAIGFNFLLAALMLQWGLICQGFYDLNSKYKIEIGIKSLYSADIATGTVLISMGAVVGRTSFMQLLLMGVLEIPMYTVNLFIGTTIFQAADAGGSIFIHTFGAYFGLATSYIINRHIDKSEINESLESSSYTSDLFAMIGTIFLWLFWPSFNAFDLNGREQLRAIVNTYLSLSSCCVVSFMFSLIFSKYKFNMVHIQNSTLAGGVAIGTSANLMVQPCGAIIIGMLVAVLSVFGYAKISPLLNNTFGIPDTCGVHNLHGMPGVFAGIVGAIMASLATESIYNNETMHNIYPARATSLYLPSIGENRTSGQQALYQIIALVVTLALAIVAGLLTGVILTWRTSSPLKPKQFFDDNVQWNSPNDDDAFLNTTSTFFIKSYPTSQPNKIKRDVFD